MATDDYYRMLAIMQDRKTIYSLSWWGGGVWDGYTHARKVTTLNINGVITFKATASVVRKPKYFLGIKIRRVIVQVNQGLTTEYTNMYVTDVLTFDPDLSDAEKTKLVNDRAAEIVQEYPPCKVTTEYARTPLLEGTPTGGVYCLLRSSDWLEIVREMNSRITEIYADPASLERTMHYKRNIISAPKDMLSEPDTDEGRRLTLMEECHKRWVENTRNLRSGSGRDGGEEARP